MTHCGKCGAKLVVGGCWKLYYHCPICNWDPDADTTLEIPVNWEMLYTFEDPNYLKKNWANYRQVQTLVWLKNQPTEHHTVVRTQKENVVMYDGDVTYTSTMGKFEILGPNGWETL
jgi:hypothetical protein